jgi:hypothetical protein
MSDASSTLAISAKASNRRTLVNLRMYARQSIGSAPLLDFANAFALANHIERSFRSAPMAR